MNGIAEKCKEKRYVLISTFWSIHVKETFNNIVLRNTGCTSEEYALGFFHSQSLLRLQICVIQWWNGNFVTSQCNLTNLYTLVKAKPDSTKNVLLLKNLQFLPNHDETLSKWVTHEYLIFTKFCHDWIEIVDFFIKRTFSVESGLAFTRV